jgi:microcystin degradation protein MlrC
MKVLGFYEDGNFHEDRPRHGGMTDADQGPTAVLQVPGGVTVMLTSLRMPPFSLSQLTTFGVDPNAFQILVAKGVNLPVAAYEEVCRHMVRANTAGVTTADMRQLEYQHRRRPLFPFEA